MTSDTDRIEKKVVLRAPRERVWNAISNAREFGTWFGVEFETDFAPGATVKGRIVPTAVDPEVAKSQQPYVGMACDVAVARIEPMRLFSFRWRPYEPDGNADPAAAPPTTLVEFVLEDAADGTLLTITESGFDAIPLEQRAQAFASNEQGWRIQATLIDKYLARAA